MKPGQIEAKTPHLKKASPPLKSRDVVLGRSSLLALPAPRDCVHEKPEQDQKRHSASVPQATQPNQP